MKKKFSVTFFETEPIGTEPGPMIRRQKKRKQKKTKFKNMSDYYYEYAVKDIIFHYFQKKNINTIISKIIFYVVNFQELISFVAMRNSVLLKSTYVPMARRMSGLKCNPKKEGIS